LKWDDGVKIKLGSVTTEMIYDAADMGDPKLLEDMKQEGEIFGVHISIPFG